MNIYKPTWLYIKKHNKTGLKYFGKTTTSDPVTYLGSGKYWKLHLKKHGTDVSTIWCYLYYDKDILIEEALAFSKSHNIVDSDEWANLKPETGIDGGGIFGRKISNEAKRKISNANRGRKMSDEYCNMRSEKQKGKTPWNKGKKGVQVSGNKGKKLPPLNQEHREKISKSLKGCAKPPRTEEHSKNISKAKLGKEGHPHNFLAKDKISKSHLGRRRMHNDQLGIAIKMVPADKIKEFLSNGWKFNRILK